MHFDHFFSLVVFALLVNSAPFALRAEVFPGFERTCRPAGVALKELVPLRSWH